MTLDAVFARINAAGIRLRNRGGELGVAGNREKLDPELLAGLRAHKAELLARMGDDGEWWTPPLIRPEMLTLVSLTQAEIDAVVATVPGGAANVQDIYPLAPLQEGFLFHHLATAEGDPYLMGGISRFASRELLDAWLQAFGAVIDRHDILRTAIVWDGLPEPVQVVWRQAPLPVEEVELDPAAGDVATQLYARFDPRHHRIDIRRAPLVRCHVAREADGEGWVLLILLHHLAGDHTTLEVLRQEVEAHLLGREHSLPRPAPFRNFVAQVRLGVSPEEHRAFFGEMLGDVDEPTAPFGLLDVRGDGSGIEAARLEVEDGLAARLRERARALGVSAATVCHVAWGQVLARASGRDDVVFGTVLFGRMQGGEGAERVMGPFINTLPIRVRTGEVEAEAGVRQTHALLAGLMRHEHASLVLAQRCSAVDASAPLFTSLLNYRYGKRRTPSTASAASKTSERGERNSYPLNLSVDDLGDGFALTLQAPASVQPLRVCEMMHTALESLVGALETEPRAALGRLDVLPGAERALVVDEWNRTEAAYPGDSSIHGLFEAAVDGAPEAVAVVFAGESLTFAELDRRANRLAHHLRGLGVGPEDRVALCMERSLDLMPVFFGILKAGAAYVAMEPTHPADRLAYVLENSGARLLITQSWLADGLPEARPETLFIDQMADVLSRESDERPESGVSSENLAYIYYTSGSTGRPKGVLMHHYGPVNYFAWARQEYLSAGGRGAPVFSSMAVDLTLANFVPLFAGQPVELLPEGPGVEALADVLRRRPGYAMIKITPTHLSLLNQVLSPEDARGAASTLVIGADNLMAEPTLFWREHAPEVRLLNEYGPTETVVGCSLYELPADRPAEGRIPFGKPIQNLTHYVLDARMQPVPVGVAGELYIGGVGVGRGYLGRAALTAEKFVPDLFSSVEGARFYRTGDRVRWLADGNLEFLGRIDFQVKVRGYRIELGEIEERLKDHPGVRHAAVLVREDVPGDPRLVAYWVGDGPVDVETLRAHLHERLPAYMVPAAYVRLEELPLGRTGKLDRKALPAPEGDAFARHGYEAPMGDAEEALAEIWAEVLGVEHVGRWDNFFELGGHSLLAVRVISRVRQVLEVEIALGEVFSRPVLSDFARAVETAARAELPPIERAPRDSSIPLSFAQQRLWFLEQLGNLGSTYHVRMRRRLTGELDRGALSRALDRIVARHEALRTTFAEVAGTPEQRIAPADVGFRLVEHDLEGRADARAELGRLMVEEGDAPFDLERGPLIRGRLVRLAADDHLLLVTMHHIVSDAWSSGVLTRELGVLYEAFRRGAPDPLPPLEVQYADYAAWQRQWVAGQVLQAQADYWTRTLTGAPELLDLPTDHPRPAQMDHVGAMLRLELDEALTAGLKALSRRHGTSLFMTLLAGWAVVLSRLSGQDDVVIGSPVANRGRREIEGLIGFFVNTLALRVDLAGAPSVADVLRRVKERTLGAQHHQDIPFEQVVELVDPARSLSHTPLFQVVFSWQNALEGGPEPTRQAPAPAPAPQPAQGAAARVMAKFDLTLGLSEQGGRITGAVEYATALFERDSVERLVGYLRRALEAMVADEHQRVDRLPLLPEPERRLVVAELNATERPYPLGACVHELFRAQAARTSDAVALSWRGERLTYAELERRANRLANALRRRGAGPEVRVGIFLPRTPDLVVAMLGVLGAGGVYAPLDPAYPRERLGYMMEDAGVTLVITDSTLADRLPEGPATLLLDRERDAIAAESAEAPESGVSPENLSHVIFTSGSTGRPKGVMIRHSSVVVLLHWLRENVTDQERSSVLFSTSINFDVSIAEVFGTLAWGGRLVLAENALELAELDEPVVHVSMVPSAAAELLQSGGIPSTVRTLNLGGEPLPAALAQGLYALPAVEKVGNFYGPTEDTTYSTYSLVPRGADRVLVGAPVANTQAYVLDAHLQPVPLGAVGELYLAGDGLSRGYANRPGMTAERFVPCPFGAPGGRMYRVMDRVRRRADGEIDYLGRTDFQVKVRGYRIEPGEIEARLAERAGVRAPVVLAREYGPGDLRLVAYYLADEPVAVDALKAHLSDRLPGYMVPAAYVWMQAYPQTPNGKVDRKALPAPEGEAFTAGEYEAPVGPVETALAEIWAELLGLDRVGRHDAFFELGGHSLLAVALTAAMRRQGLHADVRTVFAAPTLAALAAAVSGDHAEVQVPPNLIPDASPVITPEMLPLVSLTQAEIDAVVATVPGGAANVQDVYPLAPLQEGFLFHHLATTEGDPYLLLGSPASFSTRERLDAYLRALDAVIARHDVLRTAIVWENVSEPVQVVWRHAPLPVEEVEPEPAVGDMAGQLYRRLDPARYRMDIRRAPLMRACVARDAEGRWLLLLLRHHLAVDHTAIDVLREEVLAIMQGRGDQLPASLPFRNFVAQARLGVGQDEHREFFREMLGDVDEPTAPFGLLDARGDGYEMEQARQFVDAGVAGRLRERARALGVSAAALCHVAWAQVVARASGRDDVVFGTVLFGRMQGGEGADRVIGPFINTLPIRVRLGGVGVEEGVRRTHALLARLLRHEHASLALAQRSSGVEAPAPLFTALLNYRHSVLSGAAPAASGPATGQFEGRTNYPLMMSVDDLGEAMALTAHAPASVQPLRVLGMMHAALESLAQALETAPGAAAGRLDVLTEAERRLVLRELNDTRREYPRQAVVHELFEAQAGRTPDAIAVVFEGERVTYAELNARANRLAHHLRALGAGADARVGICVERSVEMVVGLLGILKAGGAYVPLDASYPVERLRNMVEDSAPAVLLTHPPLAATAAALAEGSAIPVLDLAGDQAWADRPETNPAREGVGPGNLAHVLFTSGSTGRPKGVMLEHGSLVNRLQWMQDRYGMTADEALLQKTPFSFDVSFWEFFWPLMVGARLVMARPGGHRDPAYLVEVIRREGITVAHFVPSMLPLFLEHPDADRCTSLRRVPVSGEAVSAALVRQFHQRLPGAGLYNQYGPTESGEVTEWACDARAERVSIGRAIHNSTVYVLDRAGEPVPAGVAGELFIGGTAVARGYLGRPRLTAERFVPDPFGEPGARLYRTGDLCRWMEVREGEGANDSHGTDATLAPSHSRTFALEYLGRTDFQVKVRGFRVEMGEIEARLAAHPGVREVAVLALDDGASGKRLVAYFVGDALEGETLRAHVAEALPDFMVPAAFVRLDAFPVTPNGKLDRRALPAPEADSFASQAHEEPVGDTEQALAGIWAEVLGVERVGRGDNFFALGGHSLSAVRVISRVRQVLGVEIPLTDVFSHPTVEALAARLSAPEAADPVDRAIAVRATGSEPPLFLAYTGAGSVAYAQKLHPHLRGEVPVYALPAPSLSDAQPRTVEEMAARLLRMIREVQPAGPYRLAGWSFGGVLAYEVARQLVAVGETVEFLGMLDTYPPAYFRALPPEASPGSLEDAGDADVEAYVARQRAEGRLPEHVTAPQFREMRQRGHVNDVAVRGYDLRPLPVVVHHFSATEDVMVDDPSRGWADLLPEGSLRVTQVPGSHSSMMDPANAPVLGEALSRAMELAAGGVTSR